MLGDGVLISPVLEQGGVAVRAYFPVGRWYSLFDYARRIDSTGEWRVLPTPLDETQVGHLRQCPYQHHHRCHRHRRRRRHP
jgi:alpha-glucosidase (family GH31 glycosyl hydrolase)